MDKILYITKSLDTEKKLFYCIDTYTFVQLSLVSKTHNMIAKTVKNYNRWIYIYNYYGCDFRHNLKKMIMECIRDNNIMIIFFLLRKHNNLSVSDIDMFMSYACQWCDSTMIELLWEYSIFEKMIYSHKNHSFGMKCSDAFIVQKYTDLFSKSCSSCNLNLCLWIEESYQDFCLEKINIRHYIVPSSLSYIYANICEKGDIRVAKYLFNYCIKTCELVYDFHNEDARSFRLACEYGHIPLAKWILKKTKKYSPIPINIHSKKEYSFRWACYKNNIEVAQWLWKISNIFPYKKINIHIDNNKIFDIIKMRGYDRILEWLNEINL